MDLGVQGSGSPRIQLPMALGVQGSNGPWTSVANRDKEPEVTKDAESVYLFSLYIKRETAALMH
jgi:hypothetical protein